MPAIDTRSRAHGAPSRLGPELTGPAADRAVSACGHLAITFAAAMAEGLAPKADPTTAANAVGDSHSGGIDRPRAALTDAGLA